MKQFICICIGMLAWTFSHSQQQSFTIEVSTDSVLIGNYIEVKYVLVNLDGEFEAPSFEGVQIVGGPNHSSSMSSINGDVRKQSAYSYYIEPLEEGEFYIDPAFVQTEERNWESDPIKITVLPNPDGIIERPSMSQHFQFEFGDMFGDNPFFRDRKEQQPTKKKAKAKVRKI